MWADEPMPTTFGRCFAVTDVLPFSLKRLRRELRTRGCGTVEILKRGSALDPARFRRDLRLSGRASISLLLTRVAGCPGSRAGQPVAR